LIIKISNDIDYQKIDDELLVFVLEDNSFYKFNKSASIIFELIKNFEEENKIIEEFSKLYNLSKEESKKEIIDFIKDCKKKKILSHSSTGL
jgi:hypothetical protein